MARTSRQTVWLAAAALTAALAAAPPARAAWPSRKEGVDFVVETPHYQVRTDLSAEIGQLVGTHQEALFAELHRRMGGIKPLRIRDRLKVLVFETYQRYLAEMGGSIAGSRGVFMSAKDALACWAPADELDVILATLRHEGTHQFVHHYVGSNCPVWLNEGLAVFYEHGEFAKGQLNIGQVVPARVHVIKRAIAQNKLIPLLDMLTMSNKEWLARVNAGGPDGHLQYCQAWSMVHFLAYANEGRYQPAFYQYIAHLARGRAPADAWAKSFGTNYAGFEKRWEEYIASLSPAADAECRMRLTLLATLLRLAAKRPDLVTDIATFRQALLEGRAGIWKARTPDGYELTSSDTEKLASLFKCPQDKRPDADTSYDLVPGEEGEPPGLRCTHHPGLVYRTRYVKNEKGEITGVAVSVEAARPER